jgi:ER degradation enhancer, mannosidase alpha-like 2
LSCDGGQFELVKLPLVTLIDTLDTLVILGNYTEFRRAAAIVTDHFAGSAFDFDVNVSVFETTIRVLGGLLSAHLFAVDPKLGIYVSILYVQVII